MHMYSVDQRRVGIMTVWPVEFQWERVCTFSSLWLPWGLCRAWRAGTQQSARIGVCVAWEAGFEPRTGAQCYILSQDKQTPGGLSHRENIRPPSGRTKRCQCWNVTESIAVTRFDLYHGSLTLYLGCTSPLCQDARGSQVTCRFDSGFKHLGEQNLLLLLLIQSFLSFCHCFIRHLEFDDFLFKLRLNMILDMSGFLLVLPEFLWAEPFLRRTMKTKKKIFSNLYFLCFLRVNFKLISHVIFDYLSLRVHLNLALITSLLSHLKKRLRFL